MQQCARYLESWAFKQDGQGQHQARDGNVSGPGKGPLLIGGTTISPTCGIMGIQEIVSIYGFTGSVEIRDTQKFDTSVDGNLANNGDSTPIFSKLTER